MTNRSPLHEQHDELGARFVDFGGWEMPVQYEGVLVEHEAVRTSAGVFDVSHLGRFQFSGPGATEVLQGQLCNDVTRIEPGRAQYTMALNDSGGVVDDIIVMRLDADDYWALTNGANYDDILARFHGQSGLEALSRREDTVMLAVQGPDAPPVLEAVLGTVPGRFRVERCSFADTDVLVAGTGYTGECGAELIAPAEVGAALLAALLEAGATACGLGSRDTLRLEKGYPLWGQDLDEETSPLDADLGWVVSWDHEFVGKAALEVQRDRGVAKLLVGFTTEGRRFARHGYRVRAGTSTGTVASGNFSPSLGHGIGMAYLSPPPSDDAVIEVEIRGDWYPAERADPPFLR
jgi:aminomethyltransferase